jgi:hypothetical protein
MLIVESASFQIYQTENIGEAYKGGGCAKGLGVNDNTLDTYIILL